MKKETPSDRRRRERREAVTREVLKERPGSHLRPSEVFRSLPEHARSAVLFRAGVR